MHFHSEIKMQRQKIIKKQQQKFTSPAFSLKKY